MSAADRWRSLLFCVLLGSPCIACGDTSATDATTAVDTTLDGSDSAAPETDAEADPDSVETADDDTASDTVVDEPDTTPPGPPEIVLTVNRLPAAMNGSESYQDADDQERTFQLRVNRANTSLDVMPTPQSGAITWETLSVTCTSDGESLTVGPFEAPADAPALRSVRFSAESPLDDQATIECVASVDGPAGTSTSLVSFSAATLPAALDPFPDVDEWLVVLTRDIFELDATPRADGTLDIRSIRVDGGNGILDFDEPFFLLGLFSETNLEVRARVKAQLVSRIRYHANRIFGLDLLGVPTETGVALRLWFEGDDGAPRTGDFGMGDFSMIALGGDADAEGQSRGLFGRALVDWNNQGREDDTVYGLGVFPTGLVRAILSNPAGRALLSGFIPSEGGVAVGDKPNDALFAGIQDLDTSTLPDSATRSRYNIYTIALDFGALGLASTLAHEVGHSLGLVPFGEPPTGLFAGVSGPSFLPTLAADAHVDVAGPNIMQTGASLDLAEILGGAEPVFSPLNWAYLRRELVVGPPQ
jgi:hypothetical protein